MAKDKSKKKSVLELMQSSRLRVTMNTGQKIISSERGKGSYSRKLKHKKRTEEGGE